MVTFYGHLIRTMAAIIIGIAVFLTVIPVVVALWPLLFPKAKGTDLILRVDDDVIDAEFISEEPL